MMINEPPVRSYETVHDYSLLERMCDKGGSLASPLSPLPKAANMVPVLLSGLALIVAVCALIYAYINAPLGLVPGTFASPIVVVDAKGRIISVTQGATPTTIMVTPIVPAGAAPGVLQTTSPTKASADNGDKKPFPWSKPSESSSQSSPPEKPTSELGLTIPAVPEPARIVENFVKFHSVRFKTGVVDTGWRYANSDATEPEAQWCYYKNLEVQTKGLQPTIDLHDDADPYAIRAIDLKPDEYTEARSKCQWFNNIKPSSQT
jgi:hypothetical protein